VQGPGQSPFNAYSGVMRATALQILAGWKNIVLFEDGNQLRDYVSIHDVVNANVLALSSALPNDGYHVGGGRDWSVRELASALVRISESSASITTPGLARIGDVRHTLSATKRLKSFGWSADASKTIETSTWEPYFEWLARMNLDAEAIVGPAFANMRKSGVLIEVGN
jgi:dTDP-L-rhamnose 4-epimerase